MTIKLSQNPIDYLLLGYASADLIPGGRRLGGSVSYGAYVAAAFGLRVGVLTSATDGEPLLDELAGYAEVVNIPAAETTTFENIYNDDGRTQMLRNLAGPIGPDDIPEHWKDAPLVHIGPLMGEVSPEVIDCFPNSTVMLTAQGWLRDYNGDGNVQFKHWFDEDVLRALDVVVYSDEDIAQAPELEQQMAKVARNLVVTRSEDGGTYYQQGQAHHYDAVRVNAKELTGAGDTFAVSFFIAQHKLQGNMQRATRVAAKLASCSITREGAQESAPTPAEIQEALEKIK
jgi:sugar/nucleoside kinase (ribokinase family)